MQKNGKRKNRINQYVEEKTAILEYYKAISESINDDRNPDWQLLEQAFRKFINERA